jgi:hypothetical protein
MKKVFCAAFMIIHGLNLYAQTAPAAQVEAYAFKGQAIVYFEKGSFSGPEKNMYFNLGGPALRMSKGSQSVGIFFAPSMRMRMIEGKTTQFVPVVGFGLEYGYKRMVLSACQFYKGESKVWELTGGIGYRFK